MKLLLQRGKTVAVLWVLSFFSTEPQISFVFPRALMGRLRSHQFTTLRRIGFIFIFAPSTQGSEKVSVGWVLCLNAQAESLGTVGHSSKQVAGIIPREHSSLSFNWCGCVAGFPWVDQSCAFSLHVDNTHARESMHALSFARTVWVAFVQLCFFQVTNAVRNWFSHQTALRPWNKDGVAILSFDLEIANLGLNVQTSIKLI